MAANALDLDDFLSRFSTAAPAALAAGAEPTPGGGTGADCPSAAAGTVADPAFAAAAQARGPGRLPRRRSR